MRRTAAVNFSAISARERVTAALAESSAGPRPMMTTLGLPREFVPHGRRDDLLARFGLNAVGVAEHVQHALQAR
ncbi:MAG TPA: hypothetical protein VM282_08205 [Acidimicrobiales bacterium]|nr:hypothetical protein [Acidimicrobiales bacterium]